MTLPSRNPKFDALLEELRALHESKNHDYATDGDPLSNLRASLRLGVDPWRGALVRMSDKWSRLEQIAGVGKKPKHESLRDTLIDLSAYALLTIILLDEQKP